MSFDDFCTQEFFSGDERRKFKQWLGRRANLKLDALIWWKLFAEFVRTEKK